jgi:hypothetical protein
MTDPWQGWHIGRCWNGSRVEDECPCPKAPCGLVVQGQIDPNCEQHKLTQTIRQSHPPDKCPAQGDAA